MRVKRTAEEGRKVVKAEDILAEILEKNEKGDPVKYKNVVVEGDLDLSRLKKDKDGKFWVRSPIKIENSDILGIVNIENTVILVSANFKRTNFKGNFQGMDASFRGRADFERAHFYESASFAHADFASYTNFKHAQFHKAAYFTSTKFDVKTDFRHACFHREAHFDNMQIVKHILITKKILFDEVHFIGSVRFVDAKFGGNVNFVDVWFGSDVNFVDAQFGGVTRFEGAQFDGITQFREARFEEPVSFGSCSVVHKVQFNEYVDFESARFSKYANFNSVKFSDYANFNGAQFSEDVDFKHSYFGKDAYFRKDLQLRIARFRGNTDFFEAKFNGYADFQDAHFGGDCKFESVRFGEEAYFVQVRFDGDLLLSHARFKEDAYFVGANFNKNLKLERTRFITGEFEIEWEAVKGHLDCDDRVYLALIENFKNLGWFEDADECYYDYREWRRSGKDPSRRQQSIGSKSYDTLSYVSCGHGVHPEFTIACILGTIFIFGLIFCILTNLGNLLIIHMKMNALITAFVLSQILKLSNLELLPVISLTYIYSELFQSYSSFLDSLYLSMMLFIGQTPCNFEPTGFLKFAAILESILGHLFLGLFIVVLARKFIR